MAHAEATITIDRPVEEIFDFLADGTNNKQWRHGVLEVSKTSGDGVGAVYRQTLRGPQGSTIDGDYRITTYQRPTRLAFEVIAGTARPSGDYALHADTPTSTTVTFTLDLRPKGLMRIVAPVINRRIHTGVAGIAELKRVLEQSS